MNNYIPSYLNFLSNAATKERQVVSSSTTKMLIELEDRFEPIFSLPIFFKILFFGKGLEIKMGIGIIYTLIYTTILEGDKLNLRGKFLSFTLWYFEVFYLF